MWLKFPSLFDIVNVNVHCKMMLTIVFVGNHSDKVDNEDNILITSLLYLN